MLSNKGQLEAPRMQGLRVRPRVLACGLVRWPSGNSVRASWRWLRCARK